MFKETGGILVVQNPIRIPEDSEASFPRDSEVSIFKPWPQGPPQDPARIQLWRQGLFEEIMKGQYPDEILLFQTQDPKEDLPGSNRT